MGLSRNKVAVPEGAAGTPPFWSVWARDDLSQHPSTGVEAEENPSQHAEIEKDADGCQALAALSAGFFPCPVGFLYAALFIVGVFR